MASISQEQIWIEDAQVSIYELAHLDILGLD